MTSHKELFILEKVAPFKIPTGIRELTMTGVDLPVIERLRVSRVPLGTELPIGTLETHSFPLPIAFYSLIF